MQIIDDDEIIGNSRALFGIVSALAAVFCFFHPAQPVHSPTVPQVCPALPKQNPVVPLKFTILFVLFY